MKQRNRFKLWAITVGTALAFAWPAIFLIGYVWPINVGCELFEGQHGTNEIEAEETRVARDFNATALAATNFTATALAGIPTSTPFANPTPPGTTTPVGTLTPVRTATATPTRTP